MTQPEHAVILVHSTSHAMRVEKLLRGQGIACNWFCSAASLHAQLSTCRQWMLSDLRRCLIQP